tara:strand:+ start:412 stop:2103 length:1692 start_codon:yes stop_codon:yes gene_type:complete
MGLAIGIGNGILFTSQRGVSSIIPGLIDDLCARATYCENKLCTTATLEEIAAVRYTPPPPPTGILLVDYPGASAAYSLRNLIDTTTNVVRVRRSSDNTEQDFTAVEITDGTLTTFTGANDGFVAVWYDQSTNSNNAVQPTAAQQPKIVSSGVVELENNKPCLKFSDITSNALSLNIINTFSVYAIAKSKIGQSSGYGIENLLTNLRTRNGLWGNTTDIFDFWNNGGILEVNNVNALGSGGVDSTVQNIISTSRSTGDVFGVDVISNTSFGVRQWRGTLQEMILYTETNNPDAYKIVNDINTEYNIYDSPISGLLFDYPNASVAYSLRQLTTFENGSKVNVVRVRRSSDNVERDFIDTEITDGTLVTFTGANDGFVVKWYDQSGELNDAVQTSAVNQPKLVDNGTVILDNGKPAIKYDSTGFDTLTTLNNVTGINSIFYVLNAETSTGGPTQSLLGDNFGNLDYVSGQSGDILLWTGVPNDIKNGSNYIDSQPYNFLATDRPLVQSLITMIHNSPIGAFNQISEDRSIGRSWEGKLQELVVYSSDQIANRTGIETNINTEYTIY